ncbi:MAG: hypothetical protein DRH97_00700 [Chloroflexi bacterium]|nr:MAG: hypothetical protein DRH97_00700 [Chloroflexota bacterium]|tara:strand:+ start:4503 stop:4775 length:273 start_codon:yes stop_codon:yes gene_type:complete
MSLVDAFFQPRSYQAARKLARGEPGGLTDTLNATLIRTAITLPGLLVVKIPWKQALLGSFLGNVLVSITVIGYYLNAGIDQPDPTTEENI